MSIAIVGEVDHGKSTLLGRLAALCGAVAQDRIDSIKKICAAEGREFEYAFVLDALEEERRKNITVDSSYLRLSAGGREYFFIDNPGHREFLSKMMGGSSQAEAALVIVDVTRGVTEQTRRHLRVLDWLGLEQVVFLINKMDLVGFDQAVFTRLREELSSFVAGFRSLKRWQAIPVSGREGLNLTSPEGCPDWVEPLTLLGAMAQLARARDAREAIVEGDSCFQVQSVLKNEEGLFLLGRLEEGVLCVGDPVWSRASDKTAVVKRIFRWGAPDLKKASIGDSVALELSRDLELSRGSVLTGVAGKTKKNSRLQARLLWFGNEPLEAGREIGLRVLSQEVRARVVKVESAELGFQDAVFEIADGFCVGLRDETKALSRLALVDAGVMVGAAVAEGYA